MEILYCSLTAAEMLAEFLIGVCKINRLEPSRCFENNVLVFVRRSKLLFTGTSEIQIFELISKTISRSTINYPTLWVVHIRQSILYISSSLFLMAVGK